MTDAFHNVFMDFYGVAAPFTWGFGLAVPGREHRGFALGFLNVLKGIACIIIWPAILGVLVGRVLFRRRPDQHADRD